jgi:hypothetical protein
MFLSASAVMGVDIVPAAFLHAVYLAHRVSFHGRSREQPCVDDRAGPLAGDGCKSAACRSMFGRVCNSMFTALHRQDSGVVRTTAAL